MNVTLAENIIKEKLLNDSQIEIPVELFPNNPTDYPLLNDLGDILILYTGSDFPQNLIAEGLGVLLQENLNVNIRLRMRDLRGNSGTVDYIERIKNSLLGLDITQYNENRHSRLLITAIRYVDYNESLGIWEYDIIVQFPTDQKMNELNY